MEATAELGNGACWSGIAAGRHNTPDTSPMNGTEHQWRITKRGGKWKASTTRL